MFIIITESETSETTPTSKTEFLGFTRVFSGHVSQGQELYVLHQRSRDPGETPDLRVTRSLYKTCTS